MTSLLFFRRKRREEKHSHVHGQNVASGPHVYSSRANFCCGSIWEDFLPLTLLMRPAETSLTLYSKGTDEVAYTYLSVYTRLRSLHSTHAESCDRIVQVNWWTTFRTHWSVIYLIRCCTCPCSFATGTGIHPSMLTTSIPFIKFNCGPSIQFRAHP